MEDGKQLDVCPQKSRTILAMPESNLPMHDPRQRIKPHHRRSGKRHRLTVTWSLVLLLGIGSALAEPARTNSLWKRIVMIGASVSAGFTASEPLGGPSTPQFRLSRYVDAALLVPHEPVKNLANTFFFLQPELLARQQIEQALQAKPTLVLGVDFLFWFCYGEGSTDKERLRRFEKGLKLLESFECPLILGDIPDASAAANGMLRPDQIPSATAMVAANRQLIKWAASRPNVVILRLSEFMRTAMSNHSLTIRDYTLPEGKTLMLLQHDKLHSRPPGCAAVTLAALDPLHKHQPFSSADVRWDPKENLRLVLRSLQANTNNTSNPVTRSEPQQK